VALEGELALLVVGVEDDHRLTLVQRPTNPFDTGRQGRFVTVVGAVARHEILDEAGQGVRCQLVVGYEHWRYLSRRSGVGQVGRASSREEMYVASACGSGE